MDMIFQYIDSTNLLINILLQKKHYISI